MRPNAEMGESNSETQGWMNSVIDGVSESALYVEHAVLKK